jgi:heme exporter protein B
VLLSPLLGLLYQLDGEALWMLPLGLLLGTPVLSLIGAVGAALTLGLRSAGSLILLLVLPLCIPVLIFGAGAVQAVDSGISASGHLSLLAAILIVTLMGAPVAMAMALRISME